MNLDNKKILWWVNWNLASRLSNQWEQPKNRWRSNSSRTLLKLRPRVRNHTWNSKLRRRRKFLNLRLNNQSWRIWKSCITTMWKHSQTKGNKLRRLKARANNKLRVLISRDHHWRSKKPSLSIKKKRMSQKLKNWIMKLPNWKIIRLRKSKLLNKKRNYWRNRTNNHLLNRFLYT